MKISIAMTTYNGRAYIEKQIMSILKQTRKADEIIICDDCSTDGTVDILKKILEREKCDVFYLIENTVNQGYRKNFKKSIELTSGELVFLCDQDDIWEPEKIEIVEKIFQENENIYALNSAFTLIDGNDQVIPYKCRRGFYNHDQIRGRAKDNELVHIDYSMVLRYNISPGCTMAFRGSLKKQYVNYTKSILPHDWEINLLAGMKNGCYFLNKSLIEYRIHGKNTLGMNTNDHLSALQFDNDIGFRISAIKEKKALIEMVDYWHERCRIDARQLKQYNKIKKYDLLREEAVCQHKFSAWCRLLIMTCVLWDGKYVRFKSLFGDLFYVMKRGC